MTGADIKRAAERELEKRRKLRQAEGKRFTLEAFCGEHALQLAFCRDRSQWLHVMCARQSGKTWGDLGILLDNALEAPSSKGLFLGLKGTGVKGAAWLDWKTLLDQWEIERKDNETEMLSVLPNGSRVKFGGTDDAEHIKIYLGNRLDHGVVVIDEAQDQKDGVLRYLIGQLLPPMLTATSRVVLSGVLPDVEAGCFYDLAAERPLFEAPELAYSKGFSHHEWGRSSNIHTPEAMQQLEERMERFGLTVDDPQIARDYFMRRVWDKGSTAYGYDPQRNAYQRIEPVWLDSALDEMQSAIRAGYPGRPDLLPLYQRTISPAGGDARCGIMAATPHPDIDTISMAIDQGRGDRLSLSGSGWGKHYRGVQHLFEFSSPRNANLTLGQLVPAMKVAQREYRLYGPVHWCMDGTVNEVDTFRVDCGIPAIKAPNKQDMPGQVKREKDMLQACRLLVMAGSAAEQDMLRAKWDLDARLRGQHRWASAWHPDPSESLRYTLSPYFDGFREPVSEDRRRYHEGVERAVRNAEKADPKQYDRREFESDLFDDM